MAGAAPAPFDAAGPLPGPGTTLLEASAGTGKTYALTSLIARFVGEGVPLDSILAVTFTRMATGELRDRARRRLVDAEEALTGWLDDGTVPDDAVLRAMTAGGAEEVAQRRQHLGDAVNGFDAATIATTHGFCQLVLAGLGTAGDLAPGAALVEDASDLVTQVVDDLYLRKSIRDGLPAFTATQARRAARQAVDNPGTHVVPDARETTPGLLGRLSTKARTGVAARLAQRNQLTFDRILTRLADTLDDPERGPAARDRLRRRYRVVLVDEFQDTDPTQWRILRTAFAPAPSRLILVGDPKQAIYAFRDADVRSYLEAAGRADDTRTLSTNWRSDPALLRATEALLSPLQLGDESIVVRPVSAPPGRADSGLRAAPGPAPLRFRLVASNQPGLPRQPKKGGLSKPGLVSWVAADVAADVAALLASGAELRHGGGWRPVEAADVAVLTRTNGQSLEVRDALRAAGVASVVAGLDNVFASDAARSWLALLDALLEPWSPGRVAAVALTPFVGMGVAELAGADEATLEALRSSLARWATVLSSSGVAAVQRAVTVDTGLPGRVLATVGGERVLTDLDHVGQLLQRESMGGRSGAPGLRAWLAERISLAGTDKADYDERSRRLDSDAEAVQVLTVHRSKGLEYPIVYCPYLWHASQAPRSPDPVIFHDPAAGGRRTLDVGGVGRHDPGQAAYDGHLELANAEQRAEELRVLYVALTRAAHQVVVWWAPAGDGHNSPLGRLLTMRDPVTGAVALGRSRAPRDQDIAAALEAVAIRAPGEISVEPAVPAAAVTPRSPGRGSDDGLAVATFARTLDATWRRASYTSITAAAHDARAGTAPVGSEPEEPGTADEADPAATAAPDRDAVDGGPVDAVSPMDQVPAGAELGTFVHSALERADFAADDLHGELSAAVAATRLPASGAGDPRALVAGLLAAVTTPLGPLLPGVSLAGIGRADRLDELAFELPLAGGDHPTGRVSPTDIAAVLARHQSGDALLEGYPERLADPMLAGDIRGYLTGSLDLVFRRPGPPGGRWYVADYKTNRLGDRARPLHALDYRPETLEAEMQRRHYPLQAALYLVALHRFLAWRVPGYDPTVSLGGALYLFLRGMTGPDVPHVGSRPCGVWSWSPPAQLVLDLSDLLDVGRT